jgi:fibro-slime domain-containing protein
MRNLLFPITLAVAIVGIAAAASAASVTLNATVRDFKATGTPGGHPDFEDGIASDPGIVGTTLPASKDPTYLGTAGNPTTHGAGEFDMWYGGPAVAGIDPAIVIPTTLTLSEAVAGSGIFGFSSSAFFPIDGQGYGDQGNSHNYHFTLELHTTFTYQIGQTFSFTGDDDVWVYINNSLVIDLGGVHGAQFAAVNLDTLGLTSGSIYDFDFYFAERHTTGSNLMIETSIPLVANPPSSVPESGSLFVALLATVGGLFGTHRLIERTKAE